MDVNDEKTAYVCLIRDCSLARYPHWDQNQSDLSTEGPLYKYSQMKSALITALRLTTNISW
ncbi:hypothetical protein T4B_6874 [Trichinella pseudospiralis]|uniref:Uncharacterized protein n=1 Tax=Trichinella pseudospiralis TaxID=6337 RepID=A0A0V1E3Z6_TRIPS|nr:hypothetical protein T4A_14400 [Trichinella pseudospiralis]KRY68225.1 hypothetical protein T4A_3697 [Trichinella pseudospiralis]KRZ24727.1 hypothetical protein T4B_6874 [Trichinella pseudospiralis]KRZ30432.1 hypothetical protein T4C_7096 [Trichinella pseudospiralis]